MGGGGGGVCCLKTYTMDKLVDANDTKMFDRFRGEAFFIVIHNGVRCLCPQKCYINKNLYILARWSNGILGLNLSKLWANHFIVFLIDVMILIRNQDGDEPYSWSFSRNPRWPSIWPQ